MKKKLFELKSIKKSFLIGQERYEILKGINLELYEGDFIAIMGPSGSGKSTLLNIIGCLDTPTSGSFLFKDKDIANYSSKQLALIRNESIGFIFQNFNLINSLSVKENVNLPSFYKGEEDDDRAKSLLKKVGLEERMSFKPNELSGGQKQRVAIARALMNNPPMILADEPTGALDSKTGVEIMNIICDLNEKENKTIIMVTHDENIAKKAHRIIRLKDGIII